ncbi:SOSS complex subunit C homolog [Gordionus sp. m RMFG-2023]|uniref:SOSS complex subunit C homolog n=1 Tax=Gordionus sp. m RMFG-2023 TaxID=3053472 RepID=UPI0031FD37D5
MNQEIQNRKILEEIQLKKSQLTLQALQPNDKKLDILQKNIESPIQVGIMKQVNEFTQLNPTQRLALKQAHQSSFAYFITQDSQFGNFILPVIPRYEKRLI